MTPERWKQIEHLYHLAREPKRRADVLAAVDEELRHEVETLLAREEDAETVNISESDGLFQQLGPYRIESKLGVGGMGEVFRGYDTRLHRVVAVKMLRAQSPADDTARERFQREARAASALNHPNICAIYDIGEVNENPYLVLEYLEGETLLERLTRGRLGEGELVPLARQ